MVIIREERLAHEENINRITKGFKKLLLQKTD